MTLTYHNVNKYAGSELEKVCKDRAFVLRYDNWQQALRTSAI